MPTKLKALAVLAVLFGCLGSRPARGQDSKAPDTQEGVTGVVIREGTEFAVKNIDYPNFKLVSSDLVKLSISVLNKNAIAYSIEKAGKTKSSNVEITLSGLPEGLRLYRHVGGQPSERPLTVKDGVIRYREEVGKKSHDLLTTARSTLLIDSDYTLEGDLVDSIYVNADNIRINGNGKRLVSDGVSTGVGIWIAGHTGVCVENLAISGFEHSIVIMDSQGTIIKDCDIDPIGIGGGIHSQDSRDGSYIKNTTNVKGNGFVFYRAANETVRDCVFNYPEVPEGWPPSPDARSSAIFAENMDDSVIQGNTIQAQAALDIGIIVTIPSDLPLPTGEDCENNNVDIVRNSVTGVARAVHLTSVKGKLHDNTLSGTTVDLRLRANTQATVYHNNFEGTASPKVVSTTDPLTTELSFQGVGNFYGRPFWPFWQSDDTSTGLVDSFAYGAHDGWLDTVPPAALTTLTATAGSVAIYLYCFAEDGKTAVDTGVGAYIIERAVGAEGPFSPLATISAESGWYTDFDDVVAGTLYQYRVSALDRGRNVGPISGEVSGTVPIPGAELSALGNVTVTDAAEGHLALTWNPSTYSGGTASILYTVLWSGDEQAWTAAGTTAETVYTWNSTTLTAGTHGYVRVDASAGGLTASSGSVEVTIPTTTPPDTSPPTVDVQPPTPNPTNGNLTVTATVSDSQSKIASAGYSIDNSTGSISMPAADGAFDGTTEGLVGIVDTSSISEGDHSLVVWAKDEAGNTGTSASFPFVVDRTAPLVSLAPLLPDNKTNGTLSFTVTFSDALGKIASAYWKVDQGGDSFTVDAGTPGASQAVSRTIDVSGFTEGAKVLLVGIRDAAGNEGSASAAFVLDKTAPEVGQPALDPPVTKTDPVELTVTIADFGSGVAMAEYFIGDDPGVGQGTPLALSAEPVVGTATILVVDLEEGPYTVTVRAVDNAGNTGVNSAALIIDRTPPSVSIEFPSGATATGSLEVTFKITDALSSMISAEYSTDQNSPVSLGIVPGTPRVEQTVSVVIDVSSFSEGTHVLSASARDAVSNEGTASANFTVEAPDPIAAASEAVQGDINAVRDKGTKNSLQVKYDAALRKYADGHIGAAANQLNALMQEARDTLLDPGSIISNTENLIDALQESITPYLWAAQDKNEPVMDSGLAGEILLKQRSVEKSSSHGWILWYDFKVKTKVPEKYKNAKVPWASLMIRGKVKGADGKIVDEKLSYAGTSLNKRIAPGEAEAPPGEHEVPVDKEGFWAYLPCDEITAKKGSLVADSEYVVISARLEAGELGIPITLTVPQPGLVPYLVAGPADGESTREFPPAMACKPELQAWYASHNVKGQGMRMVVTYRASIEGNECLPGGLSSDVKACAVVGDWVRTLPAPRRISPPDGDPRLVPSSPYSVAHVYEWSEKNIAKDLLFIAGNDPKKAEDLRKTVFFVVNSELIDARFCTTALSVEVRGSSPSGGTSTASTTNVTIIGINESRGPDLVWYSVKERITVPQRWLAKVRCVVVVSALVESGDGKNSTTEWHEFEGSDVTSRIQATGPDVFEMTQNVWFSRHDADERLRSLGKVKYDSVKVAIRVFLFGGSGYGADTWEFRAPNILPANPNQPARKETAINPQQLIHPSGGLVVHAVISVVGDKLSVTTTQVCNLESPPGRLEIEVSPVSSVDGVSWTRLDSLREEQSSHIPNTGWVERAEFEMDISLKNDKMIAAIEEAFPYVITDKERLAIIKNLRVSYLGTLTEAHGFQYSKSIEIQR